MCGTVNGAGPAGLVFQDRALEKGDQVTVTESMRLSRRLFRSGEAC